MHTIQCETHDRTQFLDITRQVNELLGAHRLHEGVCVVFCPHTSCGLAITSVADPLSAEDLVYAFDRLAPSDHKWKHQGPPSDADAHVKTAFIGSHLSIPVSEGYIMLGEYQSILLAEFDGPRQRKVYVSFLREV